ncbi:hypothetical protein ACQR16_17875 [Bradyrhizobium oligotrophicum]|uniref:hypothetical protein n=1 Tax=Bradyrhizobium oligotrophicum TaxID=44255 RepID=UPI003EBD14D1
MANAPGYTVWGVVNADASIQPGSSTNFTVESSQPGVYTINFDPPFTAPPAIVGTQCQYDKPGAPINESTKDGLVFPQVTANSATVETGNSLSTWVPRTFSFVAMGAMNA